MKLVSATYFCDNPSSGIIKAMYEDNGAQFQVVRSIRKASDAEVRMAEDALAEITILANDGEV